MIIGLASGHHTTHVPYGSLAKGTPRFINAEYLPISFIICDPRNLKKEEIRHFLEHLQSRQATHNADQVFRFSHYERHSQLHRALYSDGAETSTDVLVNTKQAEWKAKGYKRNKGHSRGSAPVANSLADHTSTEVNTGASGEHSLIMEILPSSGSNLIGVANPEGTDIIYHLATCDNTDIV
jgi:hypothetical protein